MALQKEQTAAEHSQLESELEAAKEAESTSANEVRRLTAQLEEAELNLQRHSSADSDIKRLQSELQACTIQHEAAMEQHNLTLSELEQASREELEAATAMLMEKRQRIEELDAERQRLEEELKKSENVENEAQAAREAAEAALKVVSLLLCMR